MEHENESHDEMLENAAAGVATILSDETLPGGRFQVVATVTGREFVLTNWQQDDAGDWRSNGCVFLKGDAAARLVALLHSAGLAEPIRRV